MWGFPGFGICPAGPYAVTVDLELTCTGGPGATASVTVPIALGYNSVDVDVTLPAGPPRLCTVAGDATTTLADGMVLTATGDTAVCIVEPSPANPSVPRLDLQHLTPEIQAVHPGISRATTIG